VKIRIRWEDNLKHYREPREYTFETEEEYRAFRLNAEEDFEEIRPNEDGSWPPICARCGSAEITVDETPSDPSYYCHECNRPWDGEPPQL